MDRVLHPKVYDEGYNHQAYIDKSVYSEHVWNNSKIVITGFYGSLLRPILKKKNIAITFYRNCVTFQCSL